MIATNIPEQIEVDLAGKGLNESITLQDANLPEGATPVSEDANLTLAVLNEPKKIEEIIEEPAEGEEGAEGAEGEAAEGGEGGDAKAEDGGEKKDEESLNNRFKFQQNPGHVPGFFV